MIDNTLRQKIIQYLNQLQGIPEEEQQDNQVEQDNTPPKPPMFVSAIDVYKAIAKDCEEESCVSFLDVDSVLADIARTNSIRYEKVSVRFVASNTKYEQHTIIYLTKPLNNIE